MARPPAIEKNGRLTFSGYMINGLILATCLGTLIYPFLDNQGIMHFDCLFKEITGWPCASCGYSTAVVHFFLMKDPVQAFLHNPGWVFWIVFQLLLAFIGFKSIIYGRQAVIRQRPMMLIIVLILLIWAGKFLIGPTYY